MDKITPTLWFDGTAEEAAAFYVGIFPDSRIDRRIPPARPTTLARRRAR